MAPFDRPHTSFSMRSTVTGPIDIVSEIQRDIVRGFFIPRLRGCRNIVRTFGAEKQ